jgi:ribokinase
MKNNAAHIVVVGSVNLDLAARVPRLPVAGETVTDAELGRYPGGKGANQALAARRLGADVCLLACVGDDAVADEALALLRAAGVDLSRLAVDPDVSTGIALIAVDAAGENQIVVAPGANRRLAPEHLKIPAADALICQLEVPVETLLHAASVFSGFFCINLAPVRDLPNELLARADLIIVNEVEANYYGESLKTLGGLLAITNGSRGAVLYRDGAEIAKALPPVVDAVDTTGAGDTFTAALTLALVEGQDADAALAFACAAAAASTTRHGAQPALPDRETALGLINS